ncbi:MAG: flagellar motor protein MotB [Halioglobus sp.]
MADAAPEEDGPPGTPAWMATFADLMSLLMCFFVLLLSFSEMDLQKYKQVAGSMKNAFGVQNQTKVMDIPKGTSIIAQEFSPGKTQPTVLEKVNQFTVETNHKSLRVGNPEAPKIENLDDEQTKELLNEQMAFLMAQTAADAANLKAILEKEIEAGMIDIEHEGRHITIRIRERGSFGSASDTLAAEFIPVMSSIREALKDIRGKISVEGHTDNIPISTARFSSNWELSAARSLRVVQELLKDKQLNQNRFMVVGLASTIPFKPNDSSVNRAANRRVEVIIRQGFSDITNSKDLNELREGRASAPEALKVETPQLGVLPDPLAPTTTATQ